MVHHGGKIPSMDEDGGKPMETSIVWGKFRGNSMEIRVDHLGKNTTESFNWFAWSVVESHELGL